MNKPNIEEVFETFQQFQNDQRHSLSGSSPGTWAKKMAEARDKLKSRFEELGLAEHIDWEDRSS